MGLLQIGWYSVATYYSTTLVLDGLGLKAYNTTLLGPGEHAFSAVFIIMAVVWGYLFAFLGGLGIAWWPGCPHTSLLCRSFCFS